MKRLIVIDISNFIFRAFFAIRPLTSPQGVPVNAVYGVLTMLHRLIQDFEATHVLVARDTKEGSFRKDKYPDYKANRTEAPDDLIPQFALIDELVEKMGLPCLAVPRYEADDIIGSVVTQYEKDFDEILIASGDKDLMQFVNDKVKMLDTMKEKIYGREDVKEKMGVYPEQIVDYLALIGDSSDNIPGVPGIGPKGAQAILEQFGTLEKSIEGVEQIKNKKAQTALRDNLPLARLSRELAEIVTNMELTLKANQLDYSFAPDEAFATFLDSLGFRSFLAKLKITPKSAPTQAAVKLTTQTDTIKELSSIRELQKFIAETKTPLYIFPVWASELDQFASLRGLAFSQQTGHAVINSLQNFSEEEIWKELSATPRSLVAWSLKEIWLRFERYHLSYETIQEDDLAQLQFMVSPESRHDLETLAREINGEGLPELQAGQQDLFADKLDNKVLVARTALLMNAHDTLLKRLHEAQVVKPYRELDLPLLRVLAKLEVTGITLDAKFYSDLEDEFSRDLSGIESEIEKVSQASVNLKSPKQVGELLFEKLNYPVIKKTKTGYSTDADVLTELDNLDMGPIPGMILRYRETDKLLSTYVKTLPKLIHPHTGRLHTHFHPDNAATGRLSSDHPNLQNIPVRTENGRRLRKGFLPAKGQQLLSADYSQVELRILAHFSQDPVMLDAFKKDRDIHLQTAAEVLAIPAEQVTKDQRNSAKAVNFGLMYGQTSFGLSQALKISQGEARDYITKYFTRFQRVKAYLDGLKDLAEETGYAETLFERKRFLPDIKSTNRQVKAVAERMAINSPIQGTAADIIKLAMIRIEEHLRKEKFTARMLLQVHDELIFEAPLEEMDSLKNIVRQFMEGAAQLTVPLKVDVGTGLNWFELK